MEDNWVVEGGWMVMLGRDDPSLFKRGANMGRRS